MTEITSRRSRRFLTRPAARFRLAFVIWSSLALLAWLLYERRHVGMTITTSHLFVAILLAGFAGMLSYFGWLMYIPTLKSRGEDDIPVEKFFAGLATLIPPCVIGLSVLPVGSPVNAWFVGFFLIVGCFALLSPHQEYLLTRHTRRMALLDPQLHWGAIRTRDGLVANPDFSRLDYAPTTLASTYARTMTRVYDEKPRPRRREETTYEPEPRRTEPRRPAAPVQESERVIRPTRIQTQPLPRVEPTPPPKAKRQTEPIKRAPQPTPRPKPKQKPRQTGTSSTLALGAAAATAAAIPAITRPAPKKPKNKKQRRKERREAEARAKQAQQAIPEPETQTQDFTPELRDYIDNDGARCIEGIVEAVFQPGQKRTYAHVAFNPTFDRKPEVLCEVADDSDVRLKSPQAFSYGTRIELTRKENIQQREVVHLQLFAQGQPTPPQ